jgi:hypothetical protein
MYCHLTDLGLYDYNASTGSCLSVEVATELILNTVPQEFPISRPSRTKHAMTNPRINICCVGTMMNGILLIGAHFELEVVGPSLVLLGNFVHCFGQI